MKVLRYTGIVADTDLELRRGQDGFALFVLPAFLPFVNFFFLPKIRGPSLRSATDVTS